MTKRTFHPLRLLAVIGMIAVIFIVAWAAYPNNTNFTRTNGIFGILLIGGGLLILTTLGFAAFSFIYFTYKWITEEKK